MVERRITGPDRRFSPCALAANGERRDVGSEDECGGLADSTTTVVGRGSSMQLASGIRRVLAVGVMAMMPLTAACDCNGNGNGNGGSGGGGGGTDPSNGPPPPAAMPDFVTQIVTWPSGLVPVGTQVRIDVTVTNVGAGDAPNRVMVAIPSTVGALTDRALGAGEAETVTIDFPAVSGNVTYTIRATADPDNVTPEENESNNMSQEISFMTLP